AGLAGRAGGVGGGGGPLRGEPVGGGGGGAGLCGDARRVGGGGGPFRGPPRSLGAGRLERGQDLGGLEQHRGVLEHLDVLHDAVLVDDEVRALGVAVDWTRLVRHERAVGRQHLTAEVRELQVLDAVFLLP